jgi:hypothetical protein
MRKGREGYYLRWLQQMFGKNSEQGDGLKAMISPRELMDAMGLAEPLVAETANELRVVVGCVLTTCLTVRRAKSKIDFGQSAAIHTSDTSDRGAS